MSEQLREVLCAILMGCLLLSPVAVKASEQGKSAETGGDDRVYKQDEVDEKAVVERKGFIYPSSMGCQEGSGTARVLVVLRKTGQVTDVIFRIKSGCENFDQQVVKAVRKVRFKPAMKDGQPVSQYGMFEYNYSVTRRGRSFS